MVTVDAFTKAYIEAMLFSSTDNSRDDGGDPLDKNYSADDLSPEARAECERACASFQTENAADILGLEPQAGHDFWLTRNGHGAGFWDGDWPEPEATRLTEASKKAGEVNPYVGDDGRIHLG